MSPPANQLPPLPPIPEGFTCPYGKQCLTREVLRYVLPILAAVAAALLAACSMRVSAPGIDAAIEAHWPQDGPATTAPARGA
jgi:hypothetical protein